jgi:signal transduction histidine kinase/ActR/RegA family two-component response regulator
MERPATEAAPSGREPPAARGVLRRALGGLILLVLVAPPALGAGVLAAVRWAGLDLSAAVTIVVASSMAIGVGFAAWAARKVLAAEAVRTAARAEREQAEAERARLLEAERLARAEAEAAVRAKDEFIATVSHELRTPLNAVLGWARLLRTGRLDPAAAAKGFEVIERSATTQAQIVDDLLDVARIARGQLRLDVRLVELVPVIEAAVDAVRPAAQARGIEIASVLVPRAGMVNGDPGRLQQVVWNLLANAIKFSLPGGRVEVRLEPESGQVGIHVRDTGAGITPAFLPHVFEPFRQADSSSTRRHGGLGLGLAIVRRIVEAHGGAVSVASEGPGKGATFTVRLPIATPTRRRAVSEAPEGGAARPAAAPRPVPLAALSGVRVVVVDDDPDTLDVVAQVLEEAGARVARARSAGEALAEIARARPDVLLSDIGMPGEDGIALIRRVRALADALAANVPAAALTAYTQAEDRRQALGAGYQAYLAKPVEPSELTAVVAKLAGRAA